MMNPSPPPLAVMSPPRVVPSSPVLAPARVDWPCDWLPPLALLIDLPPLAQLGLVAARGRAGHAENRRPVQPISRRLGHLRPRLGGAGIGGGRRARLRAIDGNRPSHRRGRGGDGPAADTVMPGCGIALGAGKGESGDDEGGFEGVGKGHILAPDRG